jgi:hypothetical protein
MILAVVALGLAVLVLAAGCGGTTTTVVKTGIRAAAPQGPSGFAALPTVKCKTLEGVHRSAVPLEPATEAAVPNSMAKVLAAYRDTAGTMIVAPLGFDCEAGIGVDGSEHVTAWPKGSPNPAQNPSGANPGAVVSLNIATACQGCIAEAVCTFFPDAKPVKFYYQSLSSGLQCPEKPLREKVSYPSASTAMFVDPPRVAGTGLGSGGLDPSLGEISYAEPIGVRKLSCTLPPDEAGLCSAIVGATFAAVPLGY